MWKECNIRIVTLLCTVAGLCVCYVPSSPSLVRTVYGYVDSEVVIPCVEGVGEIPETVMWVRDGRQVNVETLKNGSLYFPRLTSDDRGQYVCVFEGIKNSNEEPLTERINLVVRGPPSELRNMTVFPSTVYAVVMWDVGDIGNLSIQYFTLRYRPVMSTEWDDCNIRQINGDQRQEDVYKLLPNTTYLFEMWATNEAGDGDVTECISTTHYDMEEIELTKHLLQGAEDFDTRVWVVAVAIFMGTLVVLAVGICLLMYREQKSRYLATDARDETETIELVPNIILNPGYMQAESEELEQKDENSNTQTTHHLNNNTEVHPSYHYLQPV